MWRKLLAAHSGLIYYGKGLPSRSSSQDKYLFQLFVTWLCVYCTVPYMEDGIVLKGFGGVLEGVLKARAASQEVGSIAC